MRHGTGVRSRLGVSRPRRSLPAAVVAMAGCLSVAGLPADVSVIDNGRASPTGTESACVAGVRPDAHLHSIVACLLEDAQPGGSYSSDV